MICVTGAGGTVGSEVIKQLESAKARFRAAYFSKQKAEAARAIGINAVIIDYNRPETLRAAFQGFEINARPSGFLATRPNWRFHFR